MNDLQFVGRYQCLPIRCSGRLISLQNEHPIQGLCIMGLNFEPYVHLDLKLSLSFAEIRQFKRTAPPVSFRCVLRGISLSTFVSQDFGLQSVLRDTALLNIGTVFVLEHPTKHPRSFLLQYKHSLLDSVHTLLCCRIRCAKKGLSVSYL
jgi:hypothetical protein